MSTPMPQDFTNMPSQLRDLLVPLDLRLRSEYGYTRVFSKLFNLLPQELSSVFSNRLNTLLIAVRITLPSALTSPPPANLAVSPSFCALFTEFTNTLTIVLGTVFTAVTLITPSQRLDRQFSKYLSTLHTALYVDAPSNLPALINLLDDVLTDPPAAQPYSALTSFPSELFSLLSNTLPSDLHPLHTQLDIFLRELVSAMLSDFISMVDDMNELLGDLNQNDGGAASDHDLEGSTVRYVYQARRDTDTDPEKCPVCMEEMKDGDNTWRLGCLHFFHVQCISRWLETKRSCPLCRTPINATHD